MSQRVNCKGMALGVFQMRCISYKIAEANANNLERQASHDHVLPKTSWIYVMTKLIIQVMSITL